MLFGHQSDSSTDSQPAAAGVNPLAVDPATDSSFPATSSDNTTPAEPTTSMFGPSIQPTEPSAPQTAPEPEPTPAPVETVVPEPAASAPEPVAEKSDDLLSLKQQALDQLAPLVDHLEQSPEEKFKTTMMMLQSTDNQALIKEAYAAAQAIPDEKVRAQALLDVVNEINYFTQKNKDKA